MNATFLKMILDKKGSTCHDLNTSQMVNQFYVYVTKI